MMNAFSYLFARENFFLSCIVDLHEILRFEQNSINFAITFVTALFIPLQRPLVLMVDDNIDHPADNFQPHSRIPRTWRS
jgi:hypothetical protein